MANQESESRSKSDPFLSESEKVDRDDTHVLSSSTVCNDDRSKNTNTHPVRRQMIIPKALPDIDDSSMTHVSAYLDHYEVDLAWSTLSNSFFLAGCMGYLIVSACAVYSTHTRRQAQITEQYSWMYHFFLVFSPIVYLINSVIDIKWARSLQAQYRAKKAMTDHWQDWRVTFLDPNAASAARSSACDTTDGAEDDPFHISSSISELSPSPLKRPHMPWYDRLRRHVAHRRSVTAALTFGVAATFAVVAVFVLYLDLPSSTQVSFYLNAISVHIYVLSAAFALSGKRNRPWMDLGSSVPALSSPERLQDLGDLFFLIGTVADLVLCDFRFDDGNPGWSLFGSLLCLLDAILYLRSDCIIAGNVRRRKQEGCLIV